MLECLLVGLGGGLGAILRYLIGLAPVGAQGGFPWKTLAINIAGSLAIGLIAALVVKGTVSPRWELFLETGFCRGLTTFSPFALESHQLMSRGAYGEAVLYMGISLAAGLIAVVLGQRLAA